MSRDLFGNTIFEPIKGEKMPMFHEPIIVAIPIRTGADALMAQQYDPQATEPLPFDEAAIPEAEQPVDVPVRRHTPPAALPMRANVRRSLIGDVRAELDGAGVPYVNVDEAKKALFANARLRSFHFVVYMQGDNLCNLLLWCGRPTNAVRDDMTEWEKVFGDGFTVAYAIRGGDEQVRYEFADGRTFTPFRLSNGKYL